MADKSFGVKEIELIGASGTPTIESPNNLEIKAVNVAISTDITVGGMVSLGAGTSISSPGTNVLTFGTKVRITSAGNVGIGSEIPGGVLDLYHATSNTILNVKSGDAGTVLNLIDNSARSSIEQNGTSLKISSDTGAEFANSDIRLQTDGSTRVLINSVGDVLLGGLTSKNDGRNAKGITLKSPAGISFQNYGSNGSRNWRIRPDDLTSWGSLEFSVSPTDNNNTDWPDAADDVVLELKKDKNVVVSKGNLVIGTAGQGIDFSATANGGTGTPSELLDDYEEGFFNPTVEAGADNGSGGAPSLAIQAGRYIKIGKKVHCDIYIRFANGDLSTGAHARIGNLPFAISNDSYGNIGASNLTRGGGVSTFHNTTSDITTCYGNNGTAYFYLYKDGGTNFIFGGSNNVNLNGTYWIGIFEYVSNI